ncbi:MAG: hypothetical protein DRR06_06030 [Gammaproteobacteria bacterium]|nr:MAG: hypothetical protein DRR06_06030 [Gammaproteobacteria bacterium]
MTSPDGSNWEVKTAIASKAWGGLAWAPSLSKFGSVAANVTDATTWDFKTISLNVVETVTAAYFSVVAVSTKFGKFLGQAVSDSVASIDIPLLHNEPAYVTVTAEQGTQWVATHDYLVGERCFPTDPVTTPYCYQIQSVTTGISGASEPSWPLGAGQTVVNGGVTWENVWGLIEPQVTGPLPHS